MHTGSARPDPSDAGDRASSHWGNPDLVAPQETAAAGLVCFHCPKCQAPDNKALIGRFVGHPSVQYELKGPYEKASDAREHRRPGDFEYRCSTCKHFYYARSVPVKAA